MLVFSDDWGRHPSSCQHLVGKLLPRWRVDWVNTIGTRRPRLSAADLRRAAGTAREWLRREPRAAATDAQPRALPPNLRVLAPLHWPGFRNRFERELNRMLLWRALRTRFVDERDPPAAIVATAPIPADLAASTRRFPWVYYCVDDFSQWPGLDGDALGKLEVELARHVRGTTAASEPRRPRLRGLGLEATLLTHGIDPEHWRLPELAGTSDPAREVVAMFWGHADARLDARVCLAVAERARLVFVGPRADDVDPRLTTHPRIEWRGAVPYDELPRVAREADVLVMPYADLEATRAMQPLKLKEYLATGLPAVATPLPANREWSDALDLASDPREFAERVLARAKAPLPEAQRAARLRLAAEHWSAKARVFEDLLFAAADAPLPALEPRSEAP